MFLKTIKNWMFMGKKNPKLFTTYWQQYKMWIMWGQVSIPLLLISVVQLLAALVELKKTSITLLLVLL